MNKESSEICICKICKKSILKKKSRQHIGKQILSENLIWEDNEHRCSVTGSVTCDKRKEIGNTSGFGKNATEGIIEAFIWMNGAAFSLKPAANSSKKFIF